MAARSQRLGRELSPTVVIGLPHGGNAEILAAAAENRGWRLIAAPTPEQVLSEDPAWLAQMENEGGPWVVPALERCYLRHPHGLALVRRFFDRLDTGRLGEGLVGCDSWAWAYLRRAVRGCPPRALVAQALEHERLSAWLRQLAEGDGLQQTLFRQSDSGALVLPPPAALADAVDTTAGESDFVTHLAAHSRGIPGIAWSLWREALRSCPDEELAAKKDAEGTCEMGQAVWVLPWGELERPALPSGFGLEHTLVLHALLLHDGLAADLLAEVLPLATGATLGVFSELREAGLLEDRQGTLRVSAAGYPAVRQHLNGEGYLTDEF